MLNKYEQKEMAMLKIIAERGKRSDLVARCQSWLDKSPDDAARQRRINSLALHLPMVRVVSAGLVSFKS